MNTTYTSFRDMWDRKTDVTITAGGILLIGLVFPIFYTLFSGLSFEESILRTALVLFSTASLWLGCRWIVVKMGEILPWHKYPVKHLIVELLLIAFYTLAISFFEWMVIKTTGITFSEEIIFWKEYLISTIISFIISLLHEGVFFYYQWKHHLIRTEALEKEHIASKYEVLKNQINPHFLFNSLNTLLSLIEEDKDAAINYLEAMSTFLRQLLQTGDQPLITIKEELGMIQIYYSLQQKRYGDGFVLNINIPDDKLKTFIPPLTLQMLVENALKHNIVSSKNPLLVKIETTDQNYLVVENNLQKRLDNAPGTGTGLKNIRSRFSLASQKEVLITQSAFNFTVAIPLIFVNKFDHDSEKLIR